MIPRWFRRRSNLGPSNVYEVQVELVEDGAPTEPDALVLAFKALVPGTPHLDRREADLARMLAALPTTTLPALDYNMRWQRSYRNASWESLEPAAAIRLIADAADPVVVAAGLSMHRNGRIRQIGAETLGGANSASAIRWLVLRCGDWVPQVRDAASRGLERLLTPSYATALVDSLPLLDGGRFEPGRPNSDLRARVIAVLQQDAARPAVEQGAVSQGRLVRRSCIRLLVDFGVDVALLERVLSTHDSVAIAMVAAGLPTSGSTNRRTGELLAQSPMPRFRSEGFWRLIKDDHAGSEALAHAALVDSAPSVRDVSQRWFATRGHDVAEVYRAMIEEDPVAAMRGLADCGDSQDASTARRFTNDPTPAVRVVALRVLAAIGAPEDGQLFAERALTGGGKERRQAVAGLRRIGVAGFIDEIWATALASGDGVLVDRVISQLLPMAGRWKQIDISLQAAGSGDAATTQAGLEVVRRVLDRWNNGYPGTPPDIGLLRRRLDNARPSFSDPRNGHPNAGLMEALDDILNQPPRS